LCASFGDRGIDAVPALMMSRPPSFASTVCATLLLLASCSHPPPRVEDFEAAIGRLTQDELTRRFGYPQRLKRLPSGVEVWEYEFLAGHSRCVGYRVLFDQDRRSQRWEETPCR
jgi:hypothetical protein